MRLRALLGAVLTGFHSVRLCLYRLNIDGALDDAHLMTSHLATQKPQGTIPVMDRALRPRCLLPPRRKKHQLTLRYMVLDQYGEFSGYWMVPTRGLLAPMSWPLPT
ncbi:hypothetical protein GCM10009650_06030 [Nesterenkonia jeotgali]